MEGSLERRAEGMADSLRCRFRGGIRRVYNTRNLHLERCGLGCNSIAQYSNILEDNRVGFKHPKNCLINLNLK